MATHVTIQFHTDAQNYWTSWSIRHIESAGNDIAYCLIKELDNGTNKISVDVTEVSV